MEKVRNISQGRVATRLRCVGIVNDEFIATLFPAESQSFNDERMFENCSETDEAMSNSTATLFEISLTLCDTKNKLLLLLLWPLYVIGGHYIFAL